MSRYNHVVTNMNYLIKDTKEKKKGPCVVDTCFYYRPVLAFALLACITSILTVIYYKKLMEAILITISSIYILL